MIFKVITLAALVLFVGFGSGYWKGKCDSETRAEADKAVALQRLIQQSNEIAQENAEITEAWIQQQTESESITEYVKREIPKHVSEIQKTKSVCNISIATECLLNARRLNILPAVECGSLTVEGGRAASQVTEEDLINADIECADKYETIKSRHKALTSVVKSYKKRIANMRSGNGG